uniref:NADH-ubiquinone oxidoreductase chain 2 n=1 Tax=Grandidierella rubroantennata TaxID=2614733 RepID=A0A5H2Y6E7_9CRUS|nr:NADH dehydrogenase subunit 2 [Grandidierella rubroantennata]
MIHPSKIMFFSVLLFSIFLIISTDSWLITWLALEMNIMVFLPLMLKKNNKYQSETALKYFLVQVMASIIILLSLIQLKISNNYIHLLTLALMLKMAAAPLHKWMPALANGLSWETLFTLLIIQKLAPFFLLSMNMNFIFFDIIILFIIISAMVGSIMVLFQSSLQKMLAYSSIAHLAWMLSIMKESKFEWLIYFTIYSSIMFCLIYTLSFYNIFYLSQLLSSQKSKMKFWICLSFLSLGGLPPFSGFFPKMMVILILSNTEYKFLLMILIISSLFSLFMYLRIVFMTMFQKNNKNFFFKNKNNNDSIINFINMIFLPMGFMVFFLDFKLYEN